MQWNCQGIRRKKDELLDYIRSRSIDIVALQETKLWSHATFSISGYSCERVDGHYQHTAHGGVALIIHNSIPYSNIQLNTRKHQGLKSENVHLLHKSS